MNNDYNSLMMSYGPKKYQTEGEVDPTVTDGMFNLNTDVTEIYSDFDIDRIIEDRDWNDRDYDEQLKNWIEQQKESKSYKKNKRKGESRKDFKNRLDNEASNFYYTYTGLTPFRNQYHIAEGKREYTEYREGERTERGDVAKEKAVNYFTEYLDSPLLKTRLENLYPGDVEKQESVIDAKKEQLTGLLIEEQHPSEFQNMLDDPLRDYTANHIYAGTMYRPHKNIASFNDAQMDFIKDREGYVHDILPGSIVNEMSHALNVDVGNTPNKEVYTDEDYKRIGLYGLQSVSPGEAPINPNIDMSPRELELAANLKEGANPNDHDRDERNVKSDIDTIRYELYDAGMYDFSNPNFEFTPEHIEHLRNNTDKFHKSQLMFDMYEDDNILNMLNEFTEKGEEISDDVNMPMQAKTGGPLKYQIEGPMTHPITGQNMMGTQPPTFMTSVSEGGTVTNDSNIVEDYFKKSGTSENVYSLSKYQDTSRNIGGSSSFTSDFGTFYKPSDVNPTGEFSMVSSKTTPKERSKLGQFFTGQTHHPTKVESSGGELVFGPDAANQWLEKFGSQSDDKGLTESTIYAENYGSVGPVIELMGNAEESPVQNEFEAAGITETAGFKPSTTLTTDFKTQENLKEGGPIKYQTAGHNSTTQIGLGNQASSINSAITAYSQATMPPVPFNPDDTSWMEGVKDPNAPAGAFSIANQINNTLQKQSTNPFDDSDVGGTNPIDGPGSRGQQWQNTKERVTNWFDPNVDQYGAPKENAQQNEVPTAPSAPEQGNIFNTGTGTENNQNVNVDTDAGAGEGGGGGGSWDDSNVQKAGSIATIAGVGINRLSNDDDPTTWNAGEAGGSILAGAGTGAKLGATFGPVGAAVGAVGGAVVAGVSGVVKRNKARKEKAKHYTDMAQASVQNRTAELTSKTYTGYDTGRRFTAKLGGTPYIIK